MRDNLETLTRWAATLSPVGVVLYAVGLMDIGIHRGVAVALSVGGMVLLLAGAYWGTHRKRIQNYDERQLRIRFRAAYNSFLVLAGLLMTVILGVAVVAAPIGEGDTVPALVMAAVSVPFFCSLLAFQLFEGWYQRTM